MCLFLDLTITWQVKTCTHRFNHHVLCKAVLRVQMCCSCVTHFATIGVDHSVWQLTLYKLRDVM